MSKRKYSYRIEWSEGDQHYIAQCLESPYAIAHGKTPATALQKIEKIVSDNGLIETENSAFITAEELLEAPYSSLQSS